MAKENILLKVYKDLDYSVKKYSKLFKEIKNDFEVEQGKQWEDSDIETLRKAGVKALSINKIKPIIKLITGIERQSRSDFVAYPEGGEDSLVADIVTKLMKNVSKVSQSDKKLSEQFKMGVIGGLSFTEPYMDYSNDLINGKLRFKLLNPLTVYMDPDGEEYDLSDHKYIIKVTKGLSEEDLLDMFPEQENLIKKISGGTHNVDYIEGIVKHIQGTDYPSLSSGEEYSEKDGEKSYDLVDYYYRKWTTRYFVVIPEQGLQKQFNTKEEADQIASTVPGSAVVAKKIPEINHVQCVGDKIFYEGLCWCYPAWKSYPIIPFLAEYIPCIINDKALQIQGIVRTIKDLQEEFNKRRTQELRHLNASANSGFDIEEGQLDDQNEAKLKEYGSSPGVVIKRKKGSPALVRIVPMPLSQGHAQLAEENVNDLKEASGVNPDLLATTSQSQSGRAILLKQRQGLVMVQEYIDNFASTKKIMGKFILSQLKEIYTIESALKVVGDAFIAEAFTTPVNIILERGLEKVQKGEQPTELEQAVMLQYPQYNPDQPIVDEQNQLVTLVDTDSAKEMVNTILNDSEVGVYDVAVGEGPLNETVRMSNFMALSELAQQGVPIPPTVLIEMSTIPDNEKKRIIREMQQMQMAAMQAQAKQPVQESQ